VGSFEYVSNVDGVELINLKQLLKQSIGYVAFILVINYNESTTSYSC